MKQFPELTRGLSHLMEVFCLIFMAAGTVVILTLPWWLKWYLLHRRLEAEGKLYYSMLVLLAVSGICAFIILGYGRAILHDITLGDPFTKKTALRLRAIAQWCLPIGLVYLAGVVMVPSAFVVLVGLAFLFLSMLMMILAELFHQAALYKQDNDLTI